MFALILMTYVLSSNGALPSPPPPQIIGKFKSNDDCKKAADNNYLKPGANEQKTTLMCIAIGS